MIWFWLFVALALLILPVLVPVRANLRFEPVEVKVTWGPWKAMYRDSNFTLFLFGLLLPTSKKQKKKTAAPKKPSATKAKKKTKVEPKEKIKWNLALAKRLWVDPVSKVFLLRLKTFVLRTLKSLRWSNVELVYGSADPFLQGSLAGLFALVPRSERFRLASSFEPVTQLDVGVRLNLWRLLWAILGLLTTLPYLKTRRLYKELKQPA